MRTSTYILYALVGLAALCHVGLTSPVVKRQVLDNPKYIDPAEQDLETNQEQDRGKRKIEGAVELTYGAKNAILGLLFNKINSFIDAKTAWVNQLDQINVAKNRQYQIESPKDPITSFGNVFGSVLSSKLTAAGPLISLVIQNLGGASGGGSGGNGGGGLGGLLGGASGGDGGSGGGGGLGGLLGGLLGGSGGSSSGGGGGESPEAGASASAGFSLGR